MSEGFDWSYASSAGDIAPEPSEEIAPLPLPAVGESFGPFELREEIGRGGMGAVFRAFDTRTEREVALKIVISRTLESTRHKRFLREGELTAQLAHPGIVRVHSAGDVDGTLYLAYELVAGARILTEAFEGLDLRGRVSLVRDAARALGFAHAQNVIHRDVKPGNVLVDSSGKVCVADFGLAAAQGLERLTQTGAFVGTPLFMAPEQFDTKLTTGPHTDVWALGVLLYLAATGSLPFDGESLLDLGAKILASDPKPPRELNPEVNADLAAICGGAIVAEPSRRYPNGEALAADLDRYLAGEPVDARRRSQTGLGRVWRRLHKRSPYLPTAVLLMTLALPSAAVVVWWAIVRRRAETQGVMADGELRLRLRKLDQQTRQLLRARTPINDEGQTFWALRREADALEPAARDRAQLATLATCRLRLGALEGLRHLSLAEFQRARDKLLEVRDEHDTALGLDADPASVGAPNGALGGALQALDGEGLDDGTQAVERLSGALTQGATRLEVRAWRGRALARVPDDRFDPDLADDALLAMADLDSAKAPLVEPLRLAEARLCLRRGHLGRATEALERALDPPRDLRDEVRLAWVHVRLDERDPVSALGVAREGPFASSPGRDRALARCRGLASELLDRDAEFDPAKTMAVLRLMKALDPERSIPEAFIDTLLSIVETKRNREHDMTIAIADELAPESYRAVSYVARCAARFGADTAKRMLHVVERAVAMAPTAKERQGMLLIQCAVYLEISNMPRCADVANELLADPTLSQQDKARVYRYRAETFSAADAQRALDDLDRARQLGYPMEHKLHMFRANMLHGLGRKDEALAEALVYAGHGSSASAKYESAIVLVWSLARELHRREELSAALGRFVEIYATYAGWRLRLAWSLFVDGERDQAAAELTRVAEAFTAATTPVPPKDGLATLRQLRQLAPRVRETAEWARAADPRARGALDGLVEAIEALRGSGSGP